MARQPDNAFLFFAGDWLTDEKVVLLSPAAKGVYIDLLCHCWVEGSIPACSEHLARIARVDAPAFAELWRELVGMFIEHPDMPGRLTNRRIERERSLANDRAKARSDKAKRAAAKRWGAPAGGIAPSTARSNAPSIAGAMLPDAKAKAKAVLPPTPFEEGGGAGASRRGTRKRAPRAPETENDQASTEGPKIDTGPEPAPRRDLADTPVQGLVTALMRTGYRAGLMVMRRRFALTREAERLAPTGLEPDHVEQLAALALEKSNGDPGALLAHWLDGEPPRWREVLDELGAKDRQAAAEPIAAASVLGQVLEAARGSA